MDLLHTLPQSLLRRSARDLPVAEEPREAEEGRREGGGRGGRDTGTDGAGAAATWGCLKAGAIVVKNLEGRIEAWPVDVTGSR